MRANYEYSIVTISCIIFEFFDDEIRHDTHDLELWVRSHSMSLKVVLFKSLGTVSYSHSIATLAVSLAVLTQYTNVKDRLTDAHEGINRDACMNSVRYCNC